MLVKTWRVLHYYLCHPLGRRDRVGTLLRMIRWQFGSRIASAPIAMPWVSGTRLLIKTGAHGATGNLYVGLLDFVGLAFILHFMRKGDVFVDVGANIGSYSILAASCGADVIAMEPVPQTYEQLLDNVNINRFQNNITPKNMGVGSHPGVLLFSSAFGPLNHVLAPGETIADVTTVKVDTLDSVVRHGASMIKIDVEGYETEVIRGAANLLEQKSLQVVLIELLSRPPNSA